MAVKVTPMRGMNGVSPRTFEKATKYKVEEAPNGLVLTVYEGNTRVSTYNVGCWESVEYFVPLDQQGEEKAGKTEKPKVSKKTGSRIRTHPNKEVRRDYEGGGSSDTVRRRR